MIGRVPAYICDKMIPYDLTYIGQVVPRSRLVPVALEWQGPGYLRQATLCHLFSLFPKLSFILLLLLNQVFM